MHHKLGISLIFVTLMVSAAPMAAASHICTPEPTPPTCLPDVPGAEPLDPFIADVQARVAAAQATAEAVVGVPPNTQPLLDIVDPIVRRECHRVIGPFSFGSLDNEADAAVVVLSEVDRQLGYDAELIWTDVRDPERACNDAIGYVEDRLLMP